MALRISLADANDSPPKFQHRIYRAVVDEGADKFEPALKVQARDRDKTSKITYSLIGGNELGIFKIDSDSGEITLAKSAPIDISNSTKSESNGDVISLTVHASDGTFSDDAHVAVIVRDVNNNAPTFAHDLYSASIPELSPIGMILFCIVII